MDNSERNASTIEIIDPFWHRMLHACLESSIFPSPKVEPNNAALSTPKDNKRRKSAKKYRNRHSSLIFHQMDCSPISHFSKQSGVVKIAMQEEREQALRDYKVTIEYKHLKSHAPGGVYVIPSLDDLRTFYGIIFVRRGVFANGIFKFVLRLPLKYNDVNQHPRISFQSYVYNPYVEEATGELDIKTAYPNWDPSKHYLVTVLTFVKKIFYAKTFGDAQANMEARQLAEENPAAYRAKVDACVGKSQKDVYDNDPESVAKFTEEQLSHRVLRDLLKANVKDPAQVSKTALLSMISKASNV